MLELNFVIELVLQVLCQENVRDFNFTRVAISGLADKLAAAGQQEKASYQTTISIEQCIESLKHVGVQKARWKYDQGMRHNCWESCSENGHIERRVQD